MANALFDSYREDCLDSTAPNLSSDDIKISFIDHADDNPDVTSDDFYDDIAAAGIVAASGNLGTKTITDGTFDAADVTVSTVSGDQFESIVIWEDDATDASSSLIAKIDTATGLPFTPSGGDITVQWDSGSDKIFTL